MTQEKMKHKLQIHYYFNDESHAMNAFVRNQAEKHMLEAIKRIGELCESELLLETEARREGGLIEYLAFGGVALHYLAPSINNVITHYFTKDTNSDALDKKIKEETLRGLQLDNAKKEEELNEYLAPALEDKQVIRHVSNYYKKIDAYEKVIKIGFIDPENEADEHVVERRSFKNFILEDNITVAEDDEAIIEIISPVLKEGKFNWRGRYLGEKIDFSMGDYAFKKEVIDGKHTFSNGSSIYCNLEIKITFDDFGDEKRRNHSVRKVYGVQELNVSELKLRESGRQKKRRNWRDEHQGRFDFGDNETGGDE